ncbi:MAG: lysophospholipid acyltransferase family protein [Ktedonobacterales bacterium]
MSISWYAGVRKLARALVPLQARFTYSHPERVPRHGGVLLVSNHLGPTDPIFVGVRLGRQMRILAKAEIFEWPLLGWLAHRCGAVPIHRGESDREALRIALRLLADDQCVLVFPEGTYADPPEPPAMLPVKTGAAWLALKAGVPIVPVAVMGSERVWTLPRGWRIWHHPHVHLIFGEPYQPSVPPGVTMRQALHLVAEEMGYRIAALLPDAYRGRYRSAAPADHAAPPDGYPSSDNAAIAAGALRPTP